MHQAPTSDFAIFEYISRIRKAWQSIEPGHSISKSEFFTLLCITHGGMPSHTMTHTQTPITLSALATVMNQSLPAISQRISALEASGYVQRATEKADRRVSAVVLTPAGKALLEDVHGHIAGQLRVAMQAIAPAEYAQLLFLMEKVACALETIPKHQALATDTNSK